MSKKIVFFATPDIAVPSLEFLLKQSDIEVLAVVCQPDRPAGRGKRLQSPPIKKLAESYGLKIFQPEKLSKDRLILEELKTLNSDIFLTFAFGQILSQEVLDIPKNGVINLHASLLPEYRGANPIQMAILEGKKKTGITTMMTELEVDSGDILLQEEIEITDNMTLAELTQIISEQSPELIYKTIQNIENIIPKAQDSSKVTFAKKLTKEDFVIDWDKTAEEIHNKIRAITPFGHSFYNGKRVRVVESNVIPIEARQSIYGKILALTKNGIEISCNGDKILITKVQPEGKKVMNAYDWANGVRLQIGEVLGK